MTSRGDTLEVTARIQRGTLPCTKGRESRGRIVLIHTADRWERYPTTGRRHVAQADRSRLSERAGMPAKARGFSTCQLRWLGADHAEARPDPHSISPVEFEHETTPYRNLSSGGRAYPGGGPLGGVRARSCANAQSGPDPRPRRNLHAGRLGAGHGDQGWRDPEPGIAPGSALSSAE